MQVTTTEHDGILECRLSGAFGMTAYETFGQMLTQLVGPGVRGLTIELSGLTYIETIAVWMLTAAKQKALAAGIAFAIEGASGEVALALDVAQMGVVDAASLSAAKDRADIDAVVLVVDEPLSDQEMDDCRALGLSVAEHCPSSAHRVALVRYTAAVESAVTEAFAPPYSGFIERGGDSVVNIGRRCLSALRRGGCVMSVFTSTAFQIEIPRMMEQAICSRFTLGKRESDGLISLCLAEAVANAVIHGNLGVESGMRTTADGFDRFRGEMNARLADPALQRRRVGITLQRYGEGSFSVAVSDQGRGYDFGAQMAKPMQDAAKHGRGLFLIRKVARSISSEDGGRTLVMSF